MQILKGKSDRMDEKNPFAGTQDSSNQQVIYLEKWVDQAKANKAAYEAGKQPIEELRKNLDDYYNDLVEDICRFPPELVKYVQSELLINEEWNKDGIKILASTNFENNDFKKLEMFLIDELSLFLGYEKSKNTLSPLEILYLENNWNISQLKDFLLKKYNETCENNNNC